MALSFTQQTHAVKSKTSTGEKVPIIVVTSETRALGVRDLLLNANFRKFAVKASKKGVFIYSETKEDFKKIVPFLRQQKVEFFSYAPHGIKRNKKFVIFGLDVADDLSLIQDTAYSITGVVDVRRLSKVDSNGVKKDISAILVSAMPWTKLEELQERLTSIDGVPPLRVLPFHGNVGIVQCFKCQQFGHTRNYCDRPVACVRCSGPHDVKTCPRESCPPKCANCGGSHVASYRKCVKRIEAEEALQLHQNKLALENSNSS